MCVCVGGGGGGGVRVAVRYSNACDLFSPLYEIWCSTEKGDVPDPRTPSSSIQLLGGVAVDPS